MNPIVLAVGLLVLAYLGSVVFRGRMIPGFGSASGCEYLLIGVVVGPLGLGVLPRSLAELFSPLLLVGAAWLFFLAAFPLVHDLRHFRRYGAALLSLLVNSAVAVGLFALLFQVATKGLGWGDSVALFYAFAGGWISSEMTHHGVRWARAQGAQGRVVEQVLVFARASHLLLVGGACFIGGGTIGKTSILDDVGLLQSVGVSVAAGLALGLVLGLLHRLHRHDEADWGLLLGAGLLLAGASARANVMPIPAACAMGLGFALCTRERTKAARELADTEHAVMVPLLVLAGALVDWPTDWPTRLAIVAIPGGKVLLRMILGGCLAWLYPPLRPAAKVVGLTTCASGGVSLAAATLVAIQVDDPAAGWILAAAGGSALLGEVVAPTALRILLSRTTNTGWPIASTPDDQAVDVADPASLINDPLLLAPGDVAGEMQATDASGEWGEHAAKDHS